MSRHSIAWVASVLAVLACAGAPRQSYPGPERPPSEVSVLRQTTEARVLALDHLSVSGSAWALLPGWHDVTLRVRIYNAVPNVYWKVWSYCHVGFDAIAGEQYEAVVRVRKETTSGLGEKLTVEIGIAGSDGAFRAHASSCTGERPR